MIEKNFIKEYFHQKNIPKNEPIAISLSGGVDSSVLFKLISKNYTNKKNIHTIIFNHESRPEIPKEIKSLISLHDLKDTYSLKVYKIGAKLDKFSFQKKSRELRISLIIDYSKKHGIKNIFFGHHYDDLLETILLRKIQLSGIDGLVQSFSNKYYNFHFHRPLLHFPKKEIIEYAKSIKLKWFEDSTNTQNIYTRNKIRNFFLTNDYKDKIKSYTQNISNINFLNSYLNDIIKKDFSKIILSKSTFQKSPIFLQKYMLLKILKLMNSFDSIRPENINNIRLIVADRDNLNKKRSIKGGFFIISDKYLTFSPDKPFKQKIL